MIGRQLRYFNISYLKLDDVQSRIIVDFLNFTEANYEIYGLNFANTEFVINALKAIEKTYSFRWGRIMTEKQISKKAESLAYNILNIHINCGLELNSELKAFRCPGSYTFITQILIFKSFVKTKNETR